MKKRFLSALFISALCLLFSFGAKADYDAQAMILMEPSTGTVLYEKNADAPMLIASTTKIMTACVVLERCRLSEKVTVTAEQANVEGSSMFLIPGETYTVEELLTGLMLASGNNAAVALAEYTAGSLDAFAGLMNEKASEFGLSNTHFANPHGLDAEDHYASARDLALLTSKAMENPTFCRFFSMRSATVHGVVYTNHNKLLQSCDGCVGGKTGYTAAAGRTLVSCVERDGMRLICVTLSDPSDWEDHRSAYDWAYSHWKMLSLSEGEWSALTVISGMVPRVHLRCVRSAVLIPKDAEASIRIELPKFVFAPVSKGEIIGTVEVTLNGETVLRTPLVAENAVEADLQIKLSPWERFLRRWALLISRTSPGTLLWRTDGP